MLMSSSGTTAVTDGSARSVATWRGIETRGVAVHLVAEHPIRGHAQPAGVLGGRADARAILEDHDPPARRAQRRGGARGALRMRRGDRPGVGSPRGSRHARDGGKQHGDGQGRGSSHLSSQRED